MSHKNFFRPKNKGQFKFKNDFEDPFERKANRAKHNRQRMDLFQTDLEYSEMGDDEPEVVVDDDIDPLDGPVEDDDCIWPFEEDDYYHEDAAMYVDIEDWRV